MNAPPFSRAVLVGDIPTDGREFHLEAEPDERLRLADALGILEVRALTADFLVRPVPGRSYSLRGDVHAEVVQSCVVTLEPVVQTVKEEIDLTLMRADALDVRDRRREVLVDPEETDGPDLFENGRIDLGIIAAEHMALGLDPYPRKPGVGFDPHVEDKADESESPFAELARLRQRGE